MDFLEVLEQAQVVLRNKGRITYRALKYQFQLDDEGLEALKEELLFSHPEISEADGRGLIWNGSHEETQPQPSTSQSPASYTPQHLAERIRAEQQAMESRGASDGERKTITALFADLKGSTALIEGLDPEEARAIIDPALQLMMDAVHRYDGYVAQALGDGIFALFGAPIAHEDHPQRALYAALRMQEEMRSHSDQSRLKGGIPLQMRVGINTGEVVVRSIRKDDLHTDYVPVGHSTNLAARMEQMATPGSIVISEYTRKLTEGYFELKSLGAAEIKGVDEPLDVYEVLGAGPLRTRLQMSARRGLTRFVGRQSEMEQLQQALAQARAGNGQIVGVMGEPGLGKSRLFYEFKLTSQSDCRVLEAFAVSHGQGSPYLPLVELLKEYFQIEPTDDTRQRQSKVMGHVLTLDRGLEDTLPYLFSLFGIEEGQASLQQMDAQIRRQRTFEALKRLFLRESLNQPLIIVFEDLHWIDTETQGFLDTLSEGVASANVLLLTNYRPEYHHEWGHKTYYRQLRLAPLGRKEAEEFLDFLLGTDVRAQQVVPLQALKQLILAKTDGTPFFMEEVMQEFVEQEILIRVGAGLSLPEENAESSAPTEVHIPPTVQGVLAARIDRLTPQEKELLQQLAVIGRQFPVSLVKRVVARPEDELQRTLSSLQTKEYLYEQPAFPESEYVFKHALTQDVAYGTVLQEQRKRLHERTAQTIEALYADSLEDHYGTLAHHYSSSENFKKAVEYLQRAGQQAAQRSAYAETIRYLRQGLDLLPHLPANQDTQRRELQLQLTLGPAYIGAKGYAAPEVKQTYARAAELSDQLGDAAQQYTILRGLWSFYLVTAELLTLREVSEQMVRLAEREQDPHLLYDAYGRLGRTLFELGQMQVALEHFERGFALYKPGESTALRYGIDAGTVLWAESPWLLWVRGYPDRALKYSEEALTRAQTLAHPGTSSLALTYAALVHQWCGESQAALPLTEATLALAKEYGSQFWEGWTEFLRSWILVTRGEEQTGIARMQDGWALFEANWGRWSRSYYLAFLAEGYGKVGQIAEGLSALSEALVHVEATQERAYEAELYRVKGDLVLQQSQENSAEAETCFRKAIEVAQKQEAKSWELRAATSLARLWQSQGKKAEAREVLAPVYNWFTEGFDTADLKDAKTLLDELS